ncbi:hypothetical protein [Achromobacter xylosoxidans]|uniref:hypothetical protein n=1 Tax=Alcaligenes xylosoxydans xylosoxydans TaxID=85698 RepID=UPI000761D10B|nr:hypothetical protein [Achromobacter xylosoxidans]KWU18032.1 hypothetical protein AS148_14260 [Achromobacter xylosoxidans]
MATNHYKKTIETLSSFTLPGARANALTKIQHATEDQQLKTLLQPAIDHLTHTARLLASKMPTQGDGKTLFLRKEPWAALVDYCNAIVATQKPDWQVLAERAGWQPPSGG